VLSKAFQKSRKAKSKLEKSKGLKMEFKKEAMVN